MCFLPLAAELGCTGRELSLSSPLFLRLRPPGPPAQPELGRRQRLHPRVSQELCLPSLDSHCPADLGFIAEELLRRVWSWTGASLAAPAAGRGCRSCVTQTVSLGWERGRGSSDSCCCWQSLGEAAPSPQTQRDPGAAVSSAVLPSAMPHGSNHLDHSSMCCCLLLLPLPDGSHGACFSGCVVLAAAMQGQARPLCSNSRLTGS